MQNDKHKDSFFFEIKNHCQIKSFLIINGIIHKGHISIDQLVQNKKGGSYKVLGISIQDKFNSYGFTSLLVEAPTNDFSLMPGDSLFY